MHQDYFGPGQSDPLAPVRLEVVDRATDEALQRLIEAGLATRDHPRHPSPLAAGSRPGLAGAAFRRGTRESRRPPPARRAQIKNGRRPGRRGLSEEARAALLEAVAPLGCALAVENRLPEPATFQDALLPPLALAWKDNLAILRNFVGDASQPVALAVAALERI